MGGVEKISSIGSKFMVDGEDCLDGCDGAGGGEVKGGGVDLGVIKSFSGEIPGETMGESGGDIIRLGGGPVCIVGLVKFLKGMGEGMFRQEWNQPSVMKGTGFCIIAENILF
ncbi:hypothetical protein Tco_0319423 [Tanacetum coccineum]